MIPARRSVRWRRCPAPGAIYIQADEACIERGARILKENVRLVGQGEPSRRPVGEVSPLLRAGSTASRRIALVIGGSGAAFASAGNPGVSGRARFRVRPDYRKIRARPPTRRMFHYGWARPAAAIRQKRRISRTIYPWANSDSSRAGRARPTFDWIPLLKPFTGTHPRARGMDRERAHDPERVVGPRALKLAHLRRTSPTGSSG